MNMRLLLAGGAAIVAPNSALPGLLLVLRPPLLPGALSNPLLTAWLLWPTLTLAWSMSLGLSLSHLGALLVLPLAWLAGLALARTGRLEGLLLTALPAALALFTAWALWQGPDTYTGKPQGPFNDPNAFAALLNLLLLPLIGSYLATELPSVAPWQRIARLALIGGGLLAQALVASRGATLAFLLTLIPLLWIGRGLPLFKRKLVVLGVTVLVAYAAGQALLTAYQPQAQGAFARLAATLQQGDGSRIQLYRAAWAMILDHPWLGTGLGSFRLRYDAYRDQNEATTAGGWVHNDYLQLWLEAGLPMLVILLALVFWVGRCSLGALRTGGAKAVADLGYVGGVAAILLHALVNFLLYFPFLMLLMGLYLARLSPAPSGPAPEQPRALRLVATGYALVVGLLLGGQVAVEGLLGQARGLQQALLPLGIAYPRYEVAWWLSVLSPWHPVPQQVMGQELAELSGLTPDPRIVSDAVRRMRLAWRRAPCYMPLANATYLLLAQPGISPELRRQGQAMVGEALRCNPRHGLSHYYAALFADTPDAARRWWLQGFQRSLFQTERMLLAAALMRSERPQLARGLDELVEEMATQITHLEANPMLLPDPEFWVEAQIRLRHVDRQQAVQQIHQVHSSRGYPLHG